MAEFLIRTPAVSSFFPRPAKFETTSVDCKSIVTNPRISFNIDKLGAYSYLPVSLSSENFNMGNNH